MSSNTHASRAFKSGQLAAYSANVAPTNLGASTWEELWEQHVAENTKAAPAHHVVVAKQRIFVSRDYRYLSKPKPVNVACGLACILVWTAIIVLLYSPLSLALSEWAGHLVGGVCNTPTGIGASAFVPNLGALHYVTVGGTSPSFTHSVAIALVSLALICLAALQIRNTLPVGIYVGMGAFLIFVSCLVFMFLPSEFPYDLSTYSNLYMEQQIVLWLFVPMVGGLAVFITDKRPVASIICFIVIAVQCFVYGCIRYPLYLILLNQFSSLYMACLFFVLGVLFDFMQMVAVYVVYLYDVSSYMDLFEHRGDWLW